MNQTDPTAALRDRIADAIRAAACPGDCGKTEEDCAKERIQPFVWHHGKLAGVEGSPEQFADAVLAVLPEPVAEFELRGTAEIRAAALIEAADELGRMDYDTDSNDYGYDTYRDAWNGGVMDGAEKLRRLAVEAHDTGTQQPEAHEPEHSWAAELYDPAADEWVPGSRYAVRDRAVAALEHGRRIGPTWKDGTPTKRRLVRATTTYTVEEPAPVAQQPAAEAEDVCRPVEIDGEIIRVRGAAEMSDESRAALAEVIAAAKRRYLAEHSAAAQSDALREGAIARCDRALAGKTHPPHDWEPDPGKGLWHCPGDEPFAI